MQIQNFVHKIPLNDIQNIFKILNNNCRLVGGCVRDLLMGQEVGDIDIATTVTPSIVMDKLQQHDVIAVPTGINHGTITAVINNKKYEITTLRKDIKCDGRHATVQYCTSWQEDAARRDFTINSMYMDLTGNIYDYNDGIKDLYEGKLRFIGNAETRIQEDFLRILRYFRFTARLDITCFDNHILALIKNNLSGLKKLSGQRIKNEMAKLVLAKSAINSLEIMIKYGILNYIGLPNVQMKADTAFISSDYLVNFAVLLSCSDTNVHDLKESWQLSNKEADIIDIIMSSANIIGSKYSINKHIKFIYKNGRQLHKSCMEYLYMIGESPNYNIILHETKNIKIFKLPITGHDLKKIGFLKEKISIQLEIGLDYWIANNFRLTKEELLNFIKNNIY